MVPQREEEMVGQENLVVIAITSIYLASQFMLATSKERSETLCVWDSLASTGTHHWF